MSRHCLYCAKELPKDVTNNFCSKNCWTEYKKLKALDVGTDKQATVLLKRSEIQDAQIGATEQKQDSVSEYDSTFKPPSPDSYSDADVFVDATDNNQSSASAAVSEPKIPETSDSISSRLTYLENLFNQQLEKSPGTNKAQVDEVRRLMDDMALRLNKLEIDLEKVDVFLRSVDKFEDRLRRIERQNQQSGQANRIKNKGFFARLFS